MNQISPVHTYWKYMYILREGTLRLEFKSNSYELVINTHHLDERRFLVEGHLKPGIPSVNDAQ
jgi:hypothetical protein